MEILRHTDPGFAESLSKLLRKASPPPGVEQTVREILQAIRKRGDAALLEYTKQFGGPSLSASELLETRTPKVPGETARMIAAARRNVHALPANHSAKTGRCATPKGHGQVSGSARLSGSASMFPEVLLHSYPPRS